MKPDLTGASGRRFGSSALRVDGRIFAMVSRGGLVPKLPAQRVAQLITSGAVDSRNAGKSRPMKEWVNLTPRQVRSIISYDILGSRVKRPEVALPPRIRRWFWVW